MTTVPGIVEIFWRVNPPLDSVGPVELWIGDRDGIVFSIKIEGGGGTISNGAGGGSSDLAVLVNTVGGTVKTAKEGSLLVTNVESANG